jgi:hypothetical protein
MLPETIVYTAVERHSLHLVEEERTLAKTRNDPSSVDGTPVSLDDALVSAMMGLTER